MDEQEIRDIVQEEIAAYFSNMLKGSSVMLAEQPIESVIRTQADRTIHQKSIQLLDGKNIQVGRTNGTMIGTAADQKIGFYGTTPIVKQNAITGPSGSGTAGVDTPARNAITLIIAALKNIGITN